MNTRIVQRLLYIAQACKYGHSDTDGPSGEVDGPTQRRCQGRRELQFR